jgi:predicted  nucleic acid-binding Zn-ribbon protein
MDLHGNALPKARKEIRCRDCGHVYTVDAAARSSRCEVCGNIEFHADEMPRPAPAIRPKLPESRPVPAAAPAANHFSLPPELLQSFAARHAAAGAAAEPAKPAASAPSGPALPEAPAPDEILARFQSTPDGHAVQEIIERYQVEWQLWAVLVKNFGNPVYHAAYLAQVTAMQAFDEASARYREHRAVMTLSENTRWEADVADLMISRVETLATLRMEQQGSDGFRLPAWLYLLPLQSKPFRIAWITLGLLSVARLFRVI